MDLTPPVARYEQAARLLWRRVYEGEWQPGETLPGAPALARQLGLTQSVANRALEWLEQRGAVQMQAGRGSVVLPRRLYHAIVSVPWAGEGEPPGEAIARAAEIIASAGQGSPAITWHEVTPGYGVAVVDMTVEVPDAAHAATLAGGVMREAFGDGWNIAGASVSARPA